MWEGDNLEFDGIDDHIKCGYMGNFGSEMSINKPTVEVWVKTDVTNRGLGIIGSFNDGANTGVLICLNVNNSSSSINAGYIRLYLRDEDGNALSGAVHTNTGVSDGNWHHLVVSWDGPNNLMYIYVDSILQTITYHARTAPDNFANFQYPVMLASINLRGVVYLPFPGLISNVRIYNQILTLEQILESYQQTYRMV